MLRPEKGEPGRRRDAGYYAAKKGIQLTDKRSLYVLQRAEEMTLERRLHMRTVAIKFLKGMATVTKAHPQIDFSRLTALMITGRLDMIIFNTTSPVCAG